LPRAYYNEIDRYAAAWLRNLIAEGVIAPGDVDERDIRDVTPGDLAGYTQCHFFAGIGVWSYALRRAGWPDERPVWTGSCPCQPFSAAGRGGGFADERHLWPAWFHLLRVCRPHIVFGEQVANKGGLLWLDLVQSDLEGEGYACGALDSCSAGVGAPHIRQRLEFVAYANDAQRRAERAQWHVLDGAQAGRQQGDGDAGQRSGARRLADDDDDGRSGFPPTRIHGRRAGAGSNDAAQGSPYRAFGNDVDRRCLDGAGVALGDASEQRLSNAELETLLRAGRGSEGRAAQQPGRTFWSDPDWLFCRDSKWRPVEPGTFPLVDGAPARMGRLRAYGNAINAEDFAGRIRDFLEAEAAGFAPGLGVGGLDEDLIG